MLAYDYAATGQVPPDVMHRYGFGAALRYASRWRGAGSKNLTGAEVAGLHALGMGVGQVYEDGGNEMGTPQIGAQHAATWIQEWRDLGGPQGCAGYFAVDTDAFSPPQVVAYFGVVAPAMRAAGYLVGGYGPDAYARACVAAGVVDRWWETEAWGGQGPVDTLPQVVLFQRIAPTVHVPGLAGYYDEDVILPNLPAQRRLSDGLWWPGQTPAVNPRPTPIPTPPPPGQPEVVALQRAVHVNPDGAWGPITDAGLGYVRSNQHPDGSAACRAEQQACGATPDGVWRGLSQASYVSTVRAVQAALGVGVDGSWGPITDRAYVAARARFYPGH